MFGKCFKIMKPEVDYKIIRRAVKYPRLELKNGNLVVIAPHGVRVRPVIEKHQKWINKRLCFIREVKRESRNYRLRGRGEEDLKELVYMLIKRGEERLGVRPNKIFFRKMRTKWASCSSAGNITFNRMLKYLPSKLVWYITFHEMVHLKIRKHNKNFWHLIEQEFSSVKKLERKLYGFWFLVCEKENWVGNSERR